MKKRYLVVDDHAVVRQGLLRILAESPAPPAVDEAGSMREALAKTAAVAYDAVILDISLPDGSGLDALKGIKRLRPQTPVLILSIHPEEQYAVRSIKAGASGYLTKDSAPAELVAALVRIGEGRRYVGAALAERLADALDHPPEKARHETLSDREFQVLGLVAEGKTTGEIAAGLFLSPKTISTYRLRILTKLNLRTTAQLIQYAVKNGLCD